MTAQNTATTTTPTYYTPADAVDAMHDMPVGAVVAIDESMWTKTAPDTWSGPYDAAPADAVAQDVSVGTPLMRIDGLPEVRAAIAADAEAKAVADTI